MDCSLPDSSVHGIIQARIPEWVAIRFSRESSQPRDQAVSNYPFSLHLQEKNHPILNESEKQKLLSHVWLFATPWTVHGILQARILAWVAFPFSRVSSQPRDRTQVSRIAGGFFTSWATSSVHSLSHVQLFATPWIVACQASLSITISQSSLKLTSIESVVPSSHLILCHPLFLLPPTPPSIRGFSNESTLHEVAKVLEFQL